MAKYKKKYTSQSGQILLITLLVLTIATTVVLSVISRTSSDISLSNQVAESAKALSAAEAGIEESLKSGTGSGGAQLLSTGVTYNVTLTDIGGTAFVYQFPKKTTVDSVETLWLVEHDAAGRMIETPTYTQNIIDICWDQETPNPNPALIVSVWYKTPAGSYRIARAALDPDGRGNFDSTIIPMSNCSGTGLYYLKDIIFSDLGISVGSNPLVNDTLLFLRIKPLYSDTNLAVVPVGGNALPSQGNKIDSVGSVGSGVTRKVIVFQQYKTPESIFDNVIYSRENFVQ